MCGIEENQQSGRCITKNFFLVSIDGFESDKNEIFQKIPDDMRFEESVRKLIPPTHPGTLRRDFGTISEEQKEEIFLEWIKRSGMELLQFGVRHAPRMTFCDIAFPGLESCLARDGYKPTTPSGGSMVKPAKRD